MEKPHADHRPVPVMRGRGQQMEKRIAMNRLTETAVVSGEIAPQFNQAELSAEGQRFFEDFLFLPVG